MTLLSCWGSIGARASNLNGVRHSPYRLVVVHDIVVVLWKCCGSVVVVELMRLLFPLLFRRPPRARDSCLYSYPFDAGNDLAHRNARFFVYVVHLAYNSTMIISEGILQIDGAVFAVQHGLDLSKFGSKFKLFLLKSHFVGFLTYFLGIFTFSKTDDPNPSEKCVLCSAFSSCIRHYTVT